MRLTDLRHATVRSLDGRKLGRVYEVHCEDGRITALVCGAGGLIERLTGKRKGRRIAWDAVRKLDQRGLLIVDEMPSASRNRRGTRQATARRSKR